MKRLIAARCIAACVLLLSCAATAAADDTWVQLRSPNFTVVTNGGDRRARDIALQFERYRSAIQTGWPWARVQLARPIVVIAAKDEATMKMLAPQYWEKGSRLQPSSVFSAGPDAYFIALRGDIRADDRTGSNPYQTSYWAYTTLTLTSAFEHPLPLWFRSGLAEVLSNSIVHDKDIEFGRPLSDAVRTLQTGSRLKIADFLNLQATSSYYSDAATRPNFDAQAWGVMHYLLFGRPDDRADRVNQLAALLIEGKPSIDAVQEVFGSIDALDAAYLQYVKQGYFRYTVLKTPTEISTDAFAAQPIDASRVTAVRARFHIAMGRAGDARALIDGAKGQPMPAAGLFDAEAVLLDRDGKREDARAAYARAADSNSQSFFTFYRLATLEWQPNQDAVRLARLDVLLRRSIALNDKFAPAQALLADVLTAEDHAAEAVNFAKRAAVLEPGEASPRLALSRALWKLARHDEARGHALAARLLADSDQERADVQSMLDFFDRAAAPPK